MPGSISLAVCDKLAEHGKRFSSTNWPRIALLPCLDATQFYWEQLLEISQIHRLLQSQVLCHHSVDAVWPQISSSFHISFTDEVVYETMDITT